jgi:hypothetical protein
MSEGQLREMTGIMKETEKDKLVAALRYIEQFLRGKHSLTPEQSRALGKRARTALHEAGEACEP